MGYSGYLSKQYGFTLYLVSILLVFILFLPQHAMADLLLKFGVYASDKPSTMVRQFRPLLNILEEKLQGKLKDRVRIKLEIASDYEGGIEALVKGEVDFSRLGPVSYVTAKKQNDDLAIVAVESNKGAKTFLGVICVHKESGIREVQELKGKRFAFGNKLSTIGRYLSQLYLLEHGIRGADLSSWEYLGRHDKVGAAVAAKQFDGGALKESTFKKLVAKGAPLAAIATFPNVTKPWVARSGLDPVVYEALQEVLLGITDKKALKALGKDGFLAGADGDFSAIRKAIQENHNFFHAGS